MNDTEALVIGGGISGLAVAQRLAREGLKVEVWERATRPGGKIQSIARDGYLMERGAAMLLNFRPDVSRFVADAELENTKQTRADVDHRYVISEGQLKELPMKLGAFLLSDVWSTRGKLRMMLEPFIPSGGHRDETVSQFVTRRLGAEVLDKALGPYVAGLLASDPDHASARSVLPRLVALEQRYGSIAVGAFVHRVLKRKTASVTEAFSFQGGMETMAQTLASADGVCFCGEHTVTGLSRTRHGWQVAARTAAGERVVSAAQVVLSTPAYTAGALLRAPSAELSALLEGIEYASLNVVHTGFDESAIQHPLDGNGFLTQGLGGSPLIGSMWMTSVFDDRAPPGNALLCNYLGGAQYPGTVTWSNERLVGAAITALRPLLGIRAEPEMIRVDRHSRALPLYHRDYCGRTERLQQLLGTLPGLHIVANYLGGVAVRDRLACAMQTATQVVKMARRPTSTSHSLPRLVPNLQNT
jgi:protoporphyrinogen/coproporphyrinogen III oxidase